VVFLVGVRASPVIVKVELALFVFLVNIVVRTSGSSAIRAAAVIEP
jgi:hypothetical protein